MLNLSAQNQGGKVFLKCDFVNWEKVWSQLSSGGTFKPMHHTLQAQASRDDEHWKKAQNLHVYTEAKAIIKNLQQYSRNSFSCWGARKKHCPTVVWVHLEAQSLLQAPEVRDLDLAARYSFAIYWSVISFTFTISQSLWCVSRGKGLNDSSLPRGRC